MKGDAEQLIETQIRRWALEQKHPEEEEAVPPRRSLRPILTISRELGSGGTELAEIVAARLGFQLMDKEVVDLIAENTGVHRQLIQALDDRTRSAIEQWVDGVLHERLFSSADYVRALAEALIAVAHTGSAVVVGRGANFLLADEPGLHIRAVAGIEYRIRRMMRLNGIDAGQAEAMVARSDGSRRDFVQKNLHREIDDPVGYHLIVNLERVGLDAGVELVLDAYRRSTSRV